MPNFLAMAPMTLSAVDLKVPWDRTPMYNTIMGVAAGVGLLLVVRLGWLLYRNRTIAFEGWALAFGIVGLILFVTGLHMTLTWPLARLSTYSWRLRSVKPQFLETMTFWRPGNLYWERRRASMALGRLPSRVRMERRIWPILTRATRPLGLP